MRSAETSLQGLKQENVTESKGGAQGRPLGGGDIAGP